MGFTSLINSETMGSSQVQRNSCIAAKFFQREEDCDAGFSVAELLSNSWGMIVFLWYDR